MAYRWHLPTMPNRGAGDFTSNLSNQNIMSQGTIKKIIAEKGFGFIGTEKDDLFFHRNSVDGSFEDLREGDAVEFTEGHGQKGPCAENVKSV